MFRFILATFVFSSLFAHAMEFEVTSAKTGSGATVNVVRMKGMIDPQDWRRFMGVSESLEPSRDTLFTVDSPGGNAQLGLFLINKVDAFMQTQQQAGRKVWMLTVKDCSSMCVPFYYSFPVRYAQTGTRIGLHAVSMGGIAYDPDMTKIYVDNLLTHAQSRSDQKTLAFINFVLNKGDFYSTQLDPYKADDLANQDSGLIPQGSIVPSEAGLLQSL